MTKPCRIFPYQFIHDDVLKDMRNESFERGYRASKRDAIDSLRNVQAYDCSPLIILSLDTMLMPEDFMY
jgi:hypothetical protein